MRNPVVQSFLKGKELLGGLRLMVHLADFLLIPKDLIVTQGLIAGIRGLPGKLRNPKVTLHLLGHGYRPGRTEDLRLQLEIVRLAFFSLSCQLFNLSTPAVVQGAG
jgi:hypothetical protein